MSAEGPSRTDCKTEAPSCNEVCACTVEKFSTDAGDPPVSADNEDQNFHRWWGLYCRQIDLEKCPTFSDGVNGISIKDPEAPDDEISSTEGVYLGSPLSRRASELDEDLTCIRKSSEEIKEEVLCRRKSQTGDIQLSEEHQSPPPLERKDSLLEAVLAAKKDGWNGLKRTDSLESATSLSSYSSSLASDCTCDDCFLELSDKSPTQSQKQKSSNWRKVRNVVQWTPFIQTYKRHKYPWVQLAGHQGNFKAGYRQGTIMKKLCPAEAQAFQAISNDVLRTFVPECIGVVEGSDGENYLQLQDLLSDFSSPCVMDMKMGVRTYLEEELAKARIKPKLRKDMYDKMIQIDVKAPTEAEHRAKAVTKPRYMVWRETISSTATLGFRIEGVRQGDGTSSKDFKTTRTRDQVLKALAGFTEGYPQIVIGYVRRLKEIRAALENSKFFKSHELIGSSLLFVHNEDKHGIWLIDFAKTIPLPDAVKTSHNVPWSEGTHEDGYLIGLDNLIDLFEHIQESPPSLGQENIVAKEERLSGSAVEVVGDGETSSDISSSHSYEKNPSSEVDTNDIPLEVNQNNRPKNPVTTEGKKIVPLESVTQSLQSDKVPGSSVTPQRVSNVIRNEPSQKAGKKAD